MMADTGTARSVTPMAYTRIGITACGTFQTQNGDVLQGIVEMQLMRRVYPDGLDDIGNQKWRFEDLPPVLTFLSTKKLCLVGLSGPVPLIGINTMIAWQVYHHPLHGLLPYSK